MRLLLPSILALLLFPACHRHSDTTVREVTPGTWVVEGGYPSGDRFKSTLTVAPGGTYQCQFVAYSLSNVARASEMEGMFQIKDGLLVDTVTMSSYTNDQLPRISYWRILRMNESELVLSPERQTDVNYPTNEIVFRRMK